MKPTGWIRKRTRDGRTVIPVRVSANGNLVDAGTGLCPTGMAVCYRADELPWPHIYPTEQLALLAQERAEKRCNHIWHDSSHEERRCNRCGALEFTPDW